MAEPNLWKRIKMATIAFANPEQIEKVGEIAKQIDEHVSERTKKVFEPLGAAMDLRQSEFYDRFPTGQEIDRYYESYKRVIAFKRSKAGGPWSSKPSAWNSTGNMQVVKDQVKVDIPELSREDFETGCRRGGWHFIKENSFLEKVKGPEGEELFVDIQHDLDGNRIVIFYNFETKKAIIP